MNKILIIDDDEVFSGFLKTILTKNGYHCTTAVDGPQAINHLRESRPDLILLDVSLRDMSGIDLCRQVNAMVGMGTIPVIFVTGTDDEDTILECYKSGGVDYIGKPIRNYELLAKVKVQLNVQEFQHIIQEISDDNSMLKNRLLDRKLKQPDAFSQILTVNRTMNDIFGYLEMLAPSTRPILICGETGVGKELIAHVIHELSGRAGELVTVNIAGLDDLLFSDTLFGHTKGAYTGADSDRAGLIEKAAGGTLFLDEIGDLKFESQVKLLRLLQHHDFYPLGSDVVKFSSARLIAATNADLGGKVGDGTLRKDLYYRLTAHQVDIPPLRDRRSDLPILINHFMQQACTEFNRPIPKIPSVLLPMLEAYDFPGNVRELESMVYDAVTRTTGNTLDIETFRKCTETISRNPNAAVGQANGGNRLEFRFNGRYPTLKEFNEMVVNQTLDSVNGRVAVAAQLLGISKQALYKKIKQTKPASRNHG